MGELWMAIDAAQASLVIARLWGCVVGRVDGDTKSPKLQWLQPMATTANDPLSLLVFLAPVQLRYGQCLSS